MKERPSLRVAPRQVVRLGVATLATGVVLDIPPHLAPHNSMETLALVGHLVVLGGMVIVLTGLVLLAFAVPRSPRRLS